MGNNRFKLSHMIPNAWFYKLKDMSRSRNKQNGSHVMKKNKVTSPTTSLPRYSNYFSTESTRAGKLYNTPIHIIDLDIPFTTDSPRFSSKRSRSRRKTIYKPSPKVVSSSFYDVSSIESSSESDPHDYVYSESECHSFSILEMVNDIDSNSTSCRVSSSTNNDIIIDMNNESFLGGSFDPISQLGLAPILTKPVKFDELVNEDHNTLCVKMSKEESSKTQRRRKNSSHIIGEKNSAKNSTGIRLRVNSPKLSSKKLQACARRRSVSSSARSKGCSSNDAGFPEGFAVVKSSYDPESDFRESMMEMIVENNIRASKDLEDLLACYLSLNTTEYHDLIVKAFEQIWFDIAQLKL